MHILHSESKRASSFRPLTLADAEPGWHVALWECAALGYKPIGQHLSESSAHAQTNTATHDVCITPVLGCRKQTIDISVITDIVGKWIGKNIWCKSQNQRQQYHRYYELIVRQYYCKFCKKHITNSQMNHSETHPERLSMNNYCALQHGFVVILPVKQITETEKSLLELQLYFSAKSPYSYTFSQQISWHSPHIPALLLP